MKKNLTKQQQDEKAYLDNITKMSFRNVKWTRKKLEETRDALSPWNHNIRLPHKVYTAYVEDYYPSHKEIMKIVSRELHGVFKKKRVVDIGSLEGYFSTECALQGASVLGVEGKAKNLKKCEFVKSALKIKTLNFVQDDAMKVTKKKYGGFDVALVLGLLYHLDDPFTFLEHMAGLCEGFMLLDTHVAVPVTPKVGNWKPELTEMKEFKHKGKTYEGRHFVEFNPNTPQLTKDLSTTASLVNDLSVWLTEDSLVSLLHDVGFEQVSKIVFPRRAETWWTDDKTDARVLMVCVKKRARWKSKVSSTWRD